jgi:hypothetical protein
MEAWMLHVVWLLVGWSAGLFAGLVISSIGRAAAAAMDDSADERRPMRLETPGAVVERLDAGKEWSLRVMH